MLLDHLQCPFCDCPGFCGMQRWEHLPTECHSCRALASTWDLQFIPAACASLGLPLALFTMSHHMASFVQLLIEYLQACHCCSGPQSSKRIAHSIANNYFQATGELPLIYALDITVGELSCREPLWKQQPRHI